mgnify:FL=1|tara:strand:+ start:382 stop:555 length:174 start_codon:yes stop_codon:yes gene_type:complete
MKVGDLVKSPSGEHAIVVRCLCGDAESLDFRFWLVQFLDGTRDTLRESFLEVISASR